MIFFCVCGYENQAITNKHKWLTNVLSSRKKNISAMRYQFSSLKPEVYIDHIPQVVFILTS